MDSNKPDSLIFDMDGTLWDAVDSYCAVWNRTIADLGLDAAEVTRARLQPLMGKPLTIILATLIGNAPAPFMPLLEENERLMMPSLGGKVYPGVSETLKALKDAGKRLFMVSNCQETGLPAFLEYTGFGPLFTDTLSYGQTGHEKDVNIRTLIERYKLQSAVYVGDTAGDCHATHAAGIPFVWAAYGFGSGVTDAEYTIHAPEELIKIALS